MPALSFGQPSMENQPPLPGVPQGERKTTREQRIARGRRLLRKKALYGDASKSPAEDEPDEQSATPSKALKALSERIFDPDLSKTGEARTDLHSTYQKALESGASPWIDRQQKRLDRARFVISAGQIERELKDTPAHRKQRSNKEAVSKKLSAYGEEATSFDFDRVSPAMQPFNAQVERCYEAQQALNQHRTEKGIEAFKQAVTKLREELGKLSTNSPGYQAMVDKYSVKTKVAVKQPDGSIKEEERITKPDFESHGSSFILDEKEREAMDKLLKRKKIDIKTGKPESMSLEEDDRFMKPLMDEVAHVEDAIVITRLNKRGDLAALERLVKSFEKQVIFEMTNREVRKRPAQEYGVKPEHTLDDIHELRRLRERLDEQPEKILAESRGFTMTDPKGLKTQRELMLDSYKQQQEVLEKEKQALLKQFGQERMPRGGTLKASLGSLVKDLYHRVRGTKDYISNAQLLAAYQAKEADVQTRLNKLREYAVEPEKAVDRHSQVREQHRNLSQALEVFERRGATAQEKQQAIELVRGYQTPEFQKILEADLADGMTQDTRKMLIKAGRAADEYARKLTLEAQNQLTHLITLKEEMEASAKERAGEEEATRVISIVPVEKFDILDRALLREWEANAPLALSREGRKIMEKRSLAERIDDEELLIPLKKLRGQVKNSSIQKALETVRSFPLKEDVKERVQGDLEKIILMEKRIDALRQAHELEYTLKQSTNRSISKRVLAKEEKKIQDLYDFAYDRSEPAKRFFHRAA